MTAERPPTRWGLSTPLVTASKVNGAEFAARRSNGSSRVEIELLAMCVAGPDCHPALARRWSAGFDGAPSSDSTSSSWSTMPFELTSSPVRASCSVCVPRPRGRLTEFRTGLDDRRHVSRPRPRLRRSCSLRPPREAGSGNELVCVRRGASVDRLAAVRLQPTMRTDRERGG